MVCDSTKEVQTFFQDTTNLHFIEYTTDDCWARDTSALSVEQNGSLTLLDCTFNGWGGKFDAHLDNRMNANLAKHYTSPMQTVDFILEGGGIESNGDGILLTTAHCMLNQNRNKHLKREQITHTLKELFGVHTVLYLNHGYLAGDDTDSHIDTLARFISKDTIMYVACSNPEDEHYDALHKMTQELEFFAKEYDFTLIPLPLPSPIYDKEERLPATYANFLFVNGAVLVPVYGVKEDEEVLTIFRQTFQDREIIPINCATLIRQHGSLHCVTMNFASGVGIV